MLPRPSPIGAVRALRSVARQASHRTAQSQLPRTITSSHLIISSTSISSTHRLNRGFHLSTTFRKGISPESSDPQPKSRSGAAHVAEPASISTEDYHKIADEYIEGLVHKLEQMQEEKENMDCEYSVRSLDYVTERLGWH